MLISILAQCLEPHKRLVVPGLGAFIVKESGRCVVFTELLKRDDGVLRQMLLERGVGESEVAGVIDRFVSEVLHAVGQGAEVRLPGLGVLRPGSKGTIAFVYAPGADCTTTETTEAEEPCSAPEAVAAPASAPAADAAPVPARAAANSAASAPRIAQTLRSAYEDRPVSTSVRVSPDPAVKGLRYSKPLKTTDAYTYVGDSSHRHHHRHHRHHRRRSRGWLVWVVAVLAILVALCAIGYKPYNEWRNQRELEKLLKQAGMTTSAVQPEHSGADDAAFFGPESVEP